MKIPVLIVFGIVIILNIFLFSAFLKKSKKRAENEIGFPVSIAALIFFLFSLILIMLGFEAASSAVWSVYGGISAAALFAVVSIVFFVSAINSGVTYDDIRFVHTDFFGRKHEYLYSDVTGFNNKDDEYVIRCGQKSVSFFSNSSAAKDFYEKVKRKFDEYEEKTVPAPANDIFRGNLKNPGQNIFALILTFVIGMAALVMPFFLPSILAAPDESELLQKELTFYRFEEHSGRYGGKYLYLYSENEEYAYKTKSYAFISDVRRLADNCRGETVFTVLYKPDIFALNANIICGISDESGFVYYSPEDLSREEDIEELTVISIGLGMVTMLFCCFVLYAGRNPEKIKGVLLSLLFGKDGVNLK
ncbi:MAG: hypothetical protein IJ306_09375 [Oscillospiraceae bacterium]|nr:hypothetical protein [Oscillospiraceae bacterium]